VPTADRWPRRLPWPEDYERTFVGRYPCGVHPVQPSLLDGVDPGLGGLAGPGCRVPLAGGAWVELVPGWVRGSDDLFERLIRDVLWKAERRVMFDQLRDVPRLVAHYGEGECWPDLILEEMRDSLSAHYGEELGGPFSTIGLCLYRDGHDSVAWHGDTIGLGRTHDTVVAIVSLGAARRLLLRPRGGGPGLRFDLGHGDLLVMGGSCQRTWEHSVRKTSVPVGPRISLQFRPRGVG
jgi:alkylated DNA repair dioxygenase AlkB